MELIICDNTKDIPSRPLYMHDLHKDRVYEDVAEAQKKYKARFGVEPKKAYLYGGMYLYMELPKEEEKK